MNLTLAKILGAVGRTLIGAGLVILLFVGYQLWGTGVQESRAQDSLTDQFNERVALASQEGIDSAEVEEIQRQFEEDALGNIDAAVADASQRAINPAVFELLDPTEGKPVALIEIPRIGVEKVVIEGVKTDDLKKGPGHYPDTPLPGQPGNASIAGHRTTYGAPFNRIDELGPGDVITVTTVLGKATYHVMDNPEIVPPTAVEVLDDFGDNRLTLTACHPKYSARERIIVRAALVDEPQPVLPERPKDNDVQLAGEEGVDTGGPADPATTSTSSPSSTTSTTEAAPDVASVDDPADVAQETTDLDEGLGWDTGAVQPALLWGIATLGTGLAAWYLGRRWRRWPAYLLASPLVAVLLWMCFFHVDRLLPAY